MHTAAVEDSWLHEDILKDTPVWEHALPEELWKDGAFFANTPLGTLDVIGNNIFSIRAIVTHAKKSSET